MSTQHLASVATAGKRRGSLFAAAALGTSVGLVGLTGASASTALRSAPAKTPFYAGKTITLVVGSSPGGGQDSQARILAAYWGQYIAGHPQILVSDVPANSGTVAVTDVSKVYPANGLYIDLADPSVPLKQLFKVTGANYKLQNMALVGAYEGSGPVTVRSAKGADAATLESLGTGDPVVAAAVSPGSQSALDEELGMAFLKIPFKMVFGYSSNGPIGLAFKAGSADAAATSMSGYIKSFEPNADSYLLYQFGYLSKNGQNLVADQYDSQNGVVAPTLEALWQEQHHSKATPTGGEWTAIKKNAALDSIADQLLTREGTPAAAVSALQRGFKAMEASSSFQAEATPLLGELLHGPSLAQARDDLLDFLNSPKSVAQLLYGEAGYVTTTGT